MRLYLDAKSKNNIGYTPDWLKVTYEENGERLDLTLDIQGEIGYDPKCLSCRCKGDLIPWVLWNCETGDEIDLSSMDEDEVEAILPYKRVAEIVCNSDSYEIGIYPVKDNDETFKLAEEDKLSDCKGYVEIHVDGDDYTKEFEFDIELNIY